MSDLLEAIEKRGSDISAISKGLRKKDTPGTVASIASLIATVATGVPGVAYVKLDRSVAWPEHLKTPMDKGLPPPKPDDLH